MSELYPFKAGPVEPIVLPDQTVGIWVNKVYKFFKVIYYESLPRSDPLTMDFGPLAAATPTAVTQLNLLEMPDREFGQFRCYVIDDVAANLWQGRSDGRYKLKNRLARLTRWTELRDPDGHTTEFYVHENSFAFMQVLNPTDYAITQARVAFYGFRYILEDAPEYNWATKKLPVAWTRVPATAHL